MKFSFCMKMVRDSGRYFKDYVALSLRACKGVLCNFVCLVIHSLQLLVKF